MIILGINIVLKKFHSLIKKIKELGILVLRMKGCGNGRFRDRAISLLVDMFSKSLLFENHLKKSVNYNLSTVKVCGSLIL